eukprot:2220517-Rhodomonas_salina.2
MALLPTGQSSSSLFRIFSVWVDGRDGKTRVGLAHLMHADCTLFDTYHTSDTRCTLSLPHLALPNFSALKPRILTIHSLSRTSHPPTIGLSGCS